MQYEYIYESYIFKNVNVPYKKRWDIISISLENIKLQLGMHFSDEMMKVIIHAPINLHNHVAVCNVVTMTMIGRYEANQGKMNSRVGLWFQFKLVRCRNLYNICWLMTNDLSSLIDVKLEFLRLISNYHHNHYDKVLSWKLILWIFLLVYCSILVFRSIIVL